MDASLLNQKALENEKIVEKQFRKLNYFVERLDFQGSRPRPDFLVSESSGSQMICEVKTVFSGGYLADRGVHISTHDSKLYNIGFFKNPINLTKIDDCLSDAVRKYGATVADRPDLKNLPLLVALFFDLFADYLPFYPRAMPERFGDVSGILTIEYDIAMSKAFEKLDVAKQEMRLKTGLTSGLPPNTKDFSLVQNQNARRPVPRSFVLSCVTETVATTSDSAASI